MFTIYIADDDAIIRTGLTRLVFWEEIGFTVAGVFENGRALLDKILEAPPDVVLTDIRMHEVGGLDVAREIYERRLPTMVLLISGYQEFDYARLATRWGVKEYLCKPFSPLELQEVFLRIRQELEKKKQEASQRIHLEKRLQAQRRAFIAELLRQAYAGEIPSLEALEEKIALLGLDEQFVRGQVGLFSIFAGQEDFSRVTGALSWLEEGDMFFPVETQEDCILAALLTQGQPPAAETLQKKLIHLSGAQAVVRREAVYPDFQAFAAHIVQDHLKVAKTELMGRAMDYLNSHFTQDISLASVSEALYVHPASLSRLFSQKTNKTFSETLTFLRIQEAKRLLRKTRMPVAEIAAQVGYADVKYFYKQFKRATGETPASYRSGR